MNDTEPDLEKGDVQNESNNVSESRDEVLIKPQPRMATTQLLAPPSQHDIVSRSPLTAKDIEIKGIHSANSIIDEMSDGSLPELENDSIGLADEEGIKN